MNYIRSYHLKYYNVLKADLLKLDATKITDYIEKLKVFVFTPDLADDFQFCQYSSGIL